MNRTFAAVTTFLMCLLVFSMLGAAYAQAQAQGVSGLAEGNSFTYSNTYIWISTNPGDIVPSALVAQNDSTLQITVQSVTGSTITLQDVWTYTNGTQMSSAEYDEVNSGLTGSVLAYAGNLTAGQPLFPAATNMPAINDSVYRAYEGNVRLTNHIEVNNTGISGLAYSYMNLYFDQKTGICVEYYLTSVYTDAPNQVITQHLDLINSNVWQISASATSGPTPTPSQTAAANPTPTPTGSSSSNTGFPTDLILIFAVVVAVIVVAGYFLLPKGKPKPKPEQTEQAESVEKEELAAVAKEAPEEAPEKASEEENSEEDSYSI